jgi:hypothetical protein
VGAVTGGGAEGSCDGWAGCGRAWLDAELVHQRLPRLLINGQCVGLPPAPVQGNHQLLVRPLRPGLRANDGLQVADDACVLAEREIRLDPVSTTSECSCSSRVISS